VVVNNQNEKASLLKVSRQNSNHWISIKLVGSKSNRSAIGARLKCVAGSLTQSAEVRSGGSYLSQNDLRIAFGLGEKALVDLLEINWPSGAVDRMHNLAVDRFIRIQEGGTLTSQQKAK
jgi:enediyne biosynthesis protein E4